MSVIEDFLGIETPRDLEAEQAVLGAILLEAESIYTVTERISAEDFYSVAHQWIFQALVDLNEDGKPLDFVTLVSRLQDRGELEDVGGIGYIGQLTSAVPSAASVGFYAERVREMRLRRQTIETSMEMLRKAAKSQDVNEFVHAAEAAVAKLSDQAASARDFQPVRDVLMEVWEQNEIKYQNRDSFRGVTGIPSGFSDLDKMTAGFQRSDLIIVAARPSVGKTAFALNIAQNVATIAGESVAIFSLEMSATQLVQRMLTAESNVDAGRMRTGFFEGEDWEKMSMAVGTMSDAPIYIDDTPGITVTEIRSKCRRLKKDKGLGMIIIDYLQLIHVPYRPGQNRTQEVSYVSRMLKEIAKELDVPVIALSQLSRSVEQRQDKRPMLSDLRESGSIEQDADIVAFLYRDDYYDKETERKNIIEIIIAKQRNGPVGTVELVFLKNFNKFVSLDRGHSEQPARREEPDRRRQWA
jgi:replicative DNA helicase